MTYLWHWGDGHSTTTNNAKTSHTYASARTYTVTLKVTDNYSRSGSTSKKIEVRH